MKRPEVCNARYATHGCDYAVEEVSHMARYSKGAGKAVKSAMRRRKRGTLKSGRSGKKVTSRKQAIAIGLSEARKKGAKVPRKKGGRRRSRT